MSKPLLSGRTLVIERMASDVGAGTIGRADGREHADGAFIQAVQAGAILDAEGSPGRDKAADGSPEGSAC